MSARERLEQRRQRQKEMAEADAAAERRLQEEKETLERQNREAQKKLRDKERKEAEEVAKTMGESQESLQQRARLSVSDGEGAAATAEGGEDERMEMDSVEGAIGTEQLRGTVSPEGDDGEGERPRNLDFAGEEGETVSSPARKKKKKDKSKKRKEKEMQAQGTVESVLQAGKYTTGAAEEKARKEEEAKERAAKARAEAQAKAQEEAARRKRREEHQHKNKRNVVECSFVCTQEEEEQRYDELPGAVKTLLMNMQKVDVMVCVEPVEEGEDKRIWEPTLIPFDHTDLGSYVVQSGGINAFSMKKAKRWGKKRRQRVTTKKNLQCQRFTSPFLFLVTRTHSGFWTELQESGVRLEERNCILRALHRFTRCLL